MKSRVLLFTLGASLTVALAPAVRAAEQPAAHQHEKTTELGEHMEKIGRAFRALGREVKDPAKNEDALKQVAIMRVNAEAASKLQPEKTADIPAEDRAKFLSDYDEHMKEFRADIDSLEAALKANNNAEAETLVKKLKQDMDSSHKEFRKKKKDMM